jgi:hypothetical protein
MDDEDENAEEREKFVEKMREMRKEVLAKRAEMRRKMKE